MLKFSTDGNKTITGSELLVFKLISLQYADGEYLRITNADVDIVFNENTYEPFPFTASEISQSGDGQINPVTVTVANADRTIQTYALQYDLINKPVTVTDLYANTDGFITADRSFLFVIKSITTKKTQAVFTLGSGIEIFKIKLPRRKAYSDFCSYRFKSSECKYSGSDTTCKRTLAACKAKKNVINFGGFPSLPKDRIYV